MDQPNWVPGLEHRIAGSAARAQPHRPVAGLLIDGTSGLPEVVIVMVRLARCDARSTAAGQGDGLDGDRAFQAFISQSQDPNRYCVPLAY